MALSDWEADEIYFRRYEKEPAEEKIKHHEALVQEHEREFSEKSLESRREEYESFCRQFGFSQAKIDAGWDNYLKTGKM